MTGRIDPRTPTCPITPGALFDVLNTAFRRPAPRPSTPPRLMTADETTVLMLALAEDGQPLRYKTVIQAIGGEPWNVLNSLKVQGALHHAGYNDWRITEKGRIAAALAMHKDPELAAAFAPEVIEP